jgi:hypothetical protein
MFARKLVSMTAMVGSLLAITATSALAEGFVKVECNGNCSNVNLGQICDKYALNSVPVAVGCDDTAWPGSGGSSACGGSTCTPWGAVFRSDPLGAYCADGAFNDAVVTCK